MGAIHTPEFWVAVGFIVLVVAIAKPAARAMVAALDGRTERIRKTLDEAAALREEAQHLLAEYQRKQRDATREIDDILAHARNEAERNGRTATEALETSLRRREQLAMDKIAQAEADALQAVRNAAVDIAIAATRKLLADRMDGAASAALIDRAIAELPQKLH